MITNGLKCNFPFFCVYIGTFLFYQHRINVDKATQQKRKSVGKKNKQNPETKLRKL